MNKIVNTLNDRRLIALVVGLAVLGMVRSFSRR
jgi:hypothetical protein